jgi:hypothetical protein
VTKAAPSQAHEDLIPSNTGSTNVVDKRTCTLADVDHDAIVQVAVNHILLPPPPPLKYQPDNDKLATYICRDYSQGLQLAAATDKSSKSKADSWVKGFTSNVEKLRASTDDMILRSATQGVLINYLVEHVERICEQSTRLSNGGESLADSDTEGALNEPAWEDSY